MTNYALNKEKMFTDISDDIAVVINGDTGIYYGMNMFGTCLFDVLIKGAAVEQIREELVKLPGAPADIVSDFDAFVKELVSYEILIPGEEENADFTIDMKAAKQDDYKMEITAYDDAMEMLLADPIHEVKEESGWTPEKESIGYSKEETREREKKGKA